jgi:TetR/AcrR family transcriptional regulator, transcriptional repressor for nem operon
MARILKKEEHTAKRNEILDAALQLVYSKGYEKMTIQDILDQLQISKGAFYHYFDSKVDVLEAVIERMATEQVEPIFLAIVQDPHLSALEKLHHYFDMSTRWKTSKRAFVTELVKVWYSDENALARQKMLARTVEHMGPFFKEIIKQGVGEAVFTTPYPEVASQVIINLIYDLAYESGQMFIAQDVKESANLQRIETLYMAYSDVLERVLGAPKGSIQFMTTEALKIWFSSDDPLQSERFAEEAGASASLNP